MLSNADKTAAGQACSLCRSLGVSCQVTPLFGKKNVERGTKRRKQCEAPESEKGAHGHAEPTSREVVRSVGNLHPSNQVNAGSHFHTGQIKHPSSLTVKPRSLTVYPRRQTVTHRDLHRPVMETRLLDIAGLSADSLEDCIQAFFQYLGVWMELRDSHEVFLKRFQLFLALVQGRSNESMVQVEGVGIVIAASELLVLAIAARGASYTRHVTLQEKLLTRFVKICQEPNRVTDEGIDAIEGIILASELSIRPLYWDTQESKPNCLRLNPLGKGIAAELCLFHRLNEEPLLTDPNYKSISRVFWTIYVHDALRSASAGRMYRLSEQDVGWLDKEKTQENPMIALAYLARHLGRVLLSPRSRRQGISLLELKTLVGAIEEFPTRIDLSMEQLSSSAATMLTRGSDASIATEPQRKLIKGAILLGLWLRLWLNVWMQLRERKYSNLSEEMILVEDHMTEASEQIITLAKICIDHRLIEYGPNALLSTFSAWFLFHMHKSNDAQASIRKKASTPRSDKVAADMSNKARTLLHAIRSSRFPSDSAQIANRLEERLTMGSNVPMKIFSRVAERGSAILEEEGASINTSGQRQRDRDAAIFNQVVGSGSLDNLLSEVEGATVSSGDSISLQNMGIEATRYPFAIPVDNSAGTLLDQDKSPSSTNLVSSSSVVDMGNLEAAFQNDDWSQLFQMCGFDVASGTFSSDMY